MPDCILSFTKCIKAALINFIISTIDQNTMCSVKGVAHSEEPRSNYYGTPVLVLWPTTTVLIGSLSDSLIC